MVVGFFRKAIVVGLLLIAVATLVNFLVLSWHHPDTASAEVVVASLLTSALLVVVVAIATAIVVKSMSEEDSRIGAHDTRINHLQTSVKDLRQLLEKLNDKVQNTAQPGNLPKQVQDLEVGSAELAEKVRVLWDENRQKAASGRGGEAPHSTHST